MSEPVAVRILDREFLVGCAPEAREGLLRAAQLLDSKMREVRNGNRMAGIDRIAVIAALDLAHDLLQARPGNDRDRELAQGLADLNRKLDGLLAQVGH